MFRSLAIASALMISGSIAVAAPVATVFSASGQDAADIQGVVDAFRDALGPLNAPAPVAGDPGGRRQINWDAAPDFISDPNAFPGGFFNADVAPRARGISFETPDPSVDNAATGFQLSSTQASGEPVEFGLEDEFNVFSPERLFAPTGGTIFDTQFFTPDDPSRKAVSRGIGIVFTDNDYSGANGGFSNAVIELFDIKGASLGEFVAPSSPDGGLSFLGILFDAPVVSSTRIQAGLIPIDAPGADSPTTDFVAMDDFIFGEPVAAVPLPAGGVLLSAALGALVLRRRLA